MSTMIARRNLRPLVRAALIVAAYLCSFIMLDLMSRQFEELRGIVAWYPPAGLTYALVLVFGERFTPAVTIALLLSSIFIYDMPQPPYMLVLWALVISSIYGAAAVFLRHRIHFDWRLRKARDVSWLVVTAVSVSALLAILSVASSALTSDMPRNEVLRATFIWWIGETVGVLTLTPFLLVHVMPWLRQSAGRPSVMSSSRRSRARRTLSVVGQACSIALLFYWVFGVRGLDEFRPMYLITLPLIWIALDHGFTGVTTGIVVSNLGLMLAMWFLRFDLARLGELQLLAIINCIVGLPMGAVVTERKRAEETLREERQRLAGIIEGTNVGTWEWNVQTGETIFNDRWAEIIGYTPDEIAPVSIETWMRHAHPDDLAESDELLQKHFRGELDYYEFEARMRHRNGDWIWVLDRGKVTSWTADGKPLMMMGTHQDITKSKQAEAQLRQSQKMEAIGTLAGGVAHDFNNLLTGILGNIALMRTSLPAADPLLENLNAAETSARQAADLTKGLLTFGRSAMILPVSMRIADALDTTLAILKQSLPATVEIVRDEEQTAWNVLLDQSQMTQILLNLAVNARDAMMGKGTLTIRTRNEVVEEDYVQNHAFARIGEFVHISVADTGPGIPPEILEHLFEPFHTTKPTGSGTGLGLSIVYGAVKQAAGWVTAGSPTTGTGAVFDIFLPRCLDKPTASGVPVHVSVRVCSGAVLIVEDEPVVSAVAQSLLTRSGYVVLTAGDGGSALRALQEHPGTIDLILLDMTMPGMTTQEIIPALRALDPTVPILLTSGYTSSDTVKQMLEEGTVQGFLGKPYEMHELLDSVRQLLKGS